MISRSILQSLEIERHDQQPQHLFDASHFNGGDLDDTTVLYHAFRFLLAMMMVSKHAKCGILLPKKDTLDDSLC